MQSSNGGLNGLMKFFSFFGEAEGIVFLMFVVMSTLDYSDSLFNLMLMVTVTFVNGVSKTLYHDLRLFFVAQGVDAIS